MEIIIRETAVKGVLTRSNLPVADYSVNPYVGCAHGCKYCYASFMKRFTNHPEPWGGFVAAHQKPGQIRRQGAVHRLRHRPLSAPGGALWPHARAA